MFIPLIVDDGRRQDVMVEEEAEKKSRATVEQRPDGGPQKGAEWRQLVTTHILASSKFRTVLC